MRFRTSNSEIHNHRIHDLKDRHTENKFYSQLVKCLFQLRLWLQQDRNVFCHRSVVVVDWFTFLRNALVCVCLVVCIPQYSSSTLLFVKLRQHIRWLTAYVADSPKQSNFFLELFFSFAQLAYLSFNDCTFSAIYTEKFLHQEKLQCKLGHNLSQAIGDVNL